jgi:hypothetical protein
LLMPRVSTAAVMGCGFYEKDEVGFGEAG